ncbi:MAG: alpha/beta fold hydrolase [Dehalococcoidia bacterium]|nr:alpha/beta fold hydrolase [Dehalococcoidia bacterium]
MKRLISAKAILALLLVAFLLSQPAATYALEKQANGYTVADRRQYPIIFIPGMAGSTLDVQGESTINAWPGSLSVSDEAFKVLALKEDGRTPTHGVRAIATDTVKHGLGDVYPVSGPLVTFALSALPGVGPLFFHKVGVTEDLRFFPIYQGFYDYMEKEGYKLNDNPSGKVFFDFPYDFRQDNRRWTVLLDKKVDAVLKQTKSDKVILVGHSMGGLQARLYMKDPNRAKKVAAVVFMGTPHRGSPMPFYAMTDGYNFGNAKLTNTRMWEISGNWEGGYQLLPDYPFLVEEKLGKEIWGIDKINTEDWISLQEYDHYLVAEAIRFALGEKAAKPYKYRYGLPNRDFARKSMDFHKELGDSVDKYPGVKYYMIRGTDQETVQAFTYRFQDVGLAKPVLRLSKLVNKVGDGTGSFKGAEVDGLDGTFVVKSEHGAIPSNTKAQEILTDLRKKINNEDFRKGLVDNMSAFAKENIAKARRPSSFSDDGPSMFGMFKKMVLWIIDPEKIKLRDEIRGMFLAELRNARANITIAVAADKENPEHLYMVIDDYALKDAGTGVVSGATVNIKVDSYRTFEQVVKKQMDLMAAYTSGAVKVEGAGFSDRLQLKLAQWIIKYFMK